jgi:isopenicillin-N N-acyltransferase-like protein
MSVVSLDLCGTPHERGLAHGTRLQEEITALYEGWVQCAARQSPPIRELELLEFVGEHLAHASDFAPAWIEQVAGIGAGSRLGSERAFALSCWDELCSWFAVRGPGEGGRGCGCTSFAARTARGGSVIIGQNQDAWRWWKPVVIVEESDPGGSIPRTLCAAHPGVLGVLGVNEHGVGIVANSLLPSDRAPGVPFAVVLREALRQKTLADAIGTIVQAPRAGGANYVVADAEAAVDIETTHGEAHVTYVTDYFAHSNHYLNERFAGLDVGASLLPDTYLRAGRMRALLAGDDCSAEVARAVKHLADHEGAPTAICRHPARDVDDMETLAATIIVPGEAAMYVTDGPPCSSEATRFALQADSSGRAPRESPDRAADRESEDLAFRP